MSKPGNLNSHLIPFPEILSSRWRALPAAEIDPPRHAIRRFSSVPGLQFWTVVERSKWEFNRAEMGIAVSRNGNSSLEK